MSYKLENSRACVIANLTDLSAVAASPLALEGNLVANGYQDVNALQADWGDGSAKETVPLDAATGTAPLKTYPITTATTDHTYAVAGIYYLVLTVTLNNAESYELDPIKITIV